EKVSPKLVKYIYRNYDFNKPFTYHTKIMEMLDYIEILKTIPNIPQYIFEIDEFLFWAKCISRNLFFIFKDRYQFYDFYTQTISIKLSEVRRNLGNYPPWITNLKMIYKYLYLGIISASGNWKNSKKIFQKVFKEINTKN